MGITEDQQTLYHIITTCPFCLRVRHVVMKFGLNIRIKNIRKDHHAREELICGGGKSTAPCLRIDENNEKTKWMYESKDIISYLKEHFA